MNDEKAFPGECYPGYYFHETYPEGFDVLFDPDEPVWTVFGKIPAWIRNRIHETPVKAALPSAFEGWTRPALDGGEEKVVTAVKGFVAETDIAVPEWGLYIGSGVVIEPTVVIKAPAFLGRGTEVRQGAYIRGNVVIGPHCTVGHNTEIKSAVFIRRAEAGHFAYIGDSILGSFVNLGAGTKLANLPFRSLEDKRKEIFSEFPLTYKNETIVTGLSKLGAILGDGVETGCNATLAPGTFLGPRTWVYPCYYLRKGFYPAGRIIKSDARQVSFPQRSS